MKSVIIILILVILSALEPLRRRCPRDAEALAEAQALAQVLWL